MIEAICDLLSSTVPNPYFSVRHCHTVFWNNRIYIFYHDGIQKVRICYVSMIDNTVVVHNSLEAQYSWKSIELADPYLPEKVWCAIIEYVPKGAHGNP